MDWVIAILMFLASLVSPSKPATCSVQGVAIGPGTDDRIYASVRTQTGHVGEYVWLYDRHTPTDPPILDEVLPALDSDLMFTDAAASNETFYVAQAVGKGDEVIFTMIDLQEPMEVYRFDLSTCRT